MSNSVFLPKNSDNQSIKDVLSATSALPSWLNSADKNPKNLKKDINNLLHELQGGKKSSRKTSKGSKGSKKSSKKMITHEQLGGAKKAKKQSKKSSRKSSRKSSKKLIEEIVGGARKMSKKPSKKTSKKPSKKTSKKLSGGAYEVNNEYIELSRPKKHSKKHSKKDSKKDSKKHSKKHYKKHYENDSERSTKKVSKKNSKKQSKNKMGRELPLAIVKGNEFKEHVQKDMSLKGGPVLMTFSYMIWNEFKAKNSNATPDELFKGAMNLYNEYKKKGSLESMYKQAEKKFAEKKAAKKEAKKAAKMNSSE